MSSGDRPPPGSDQDGPGPVKPAPGKRNPARLAAELRANLRRRKAKERARALPPGQADETGDKGNG
jgi:hypothetical protein